MHVQPFDSLHRRTVTAMSSLRDGVSVRPVEIRLAEVRLAQVHSAEIYLFDGATSPPFVPGRDALSWRMITPTMSKVWRLMARPVSHQPFRGQASPQVALTMGQGMRCIHAFDYRREELDRAP